MTNHEADKTDRIIVGVDVLEDSKTALKWAMSQAALTGATIEADADLLVVGSRGAWHVRGHRARLGQPALRAARTLPGCRRAVTDKPQILRGRR